MKRLSLVPVVLLLAAVATATVFQPRTDRELTARADAVVVALVRDSAPRLRADGYVVTDSHLIVEQALKGSVPDVVTVSEVGGTVGRKTTFIEGSATYAPGERVIAFLRARGDGTFFTESMTMGRFAIRNGLAQREGSEVPLESPRRVDAFVNYVRDTARGELPKASYFAAAASVMPPIVPNGTAKSYALTAGGFPVRWFVSTVTFKVNANGSSLTGINSGLSAWTNDPASNINLVNGGTSASTAPVSDGAENVIYLNYSGSFSIPGAFCDGALACTIGGGNSSNNTFDGDNWVDISDADIIIAPSVSQSIFPTLITHELGHAIGIRHSNVASPSSTIAIMNSVINSQYGTTLQQWDKDAVDSLYGSGPVCAPPSQVTTNPLVSANVPSGQTTQINAIVGAGTAPYHYQWYDGAFGVTTTPVGSDSATFTTPPITTTKSYWVHVTNACGSADSGTVTLTPTTTCQKPIITTQPTETSVGSGMIAQLTVGHSGTPPFSYQWYIGTTGDISNPAPNGTTKDFTTPPLTQATSFWVRVTNSCGSADSAAATVHVVSCGGGPTFVLQPANMTLNSDQRAYLIASASSATSYQWYQGTAPDTSTPVTAQTPSNSRFITQLYLDLLHRPPDSGAGALIGLLDTASLTRTQVAALVLGSDEYRSLLIGADYNTFLHRGPTPLDIAYWLPAFTGGMTVEQFEAQIFASPEYYALAGGTNTQWIDHVFNDVLHRSPSALDTSNFLTVLSSGSRASTALMITTSLEARSKLVRSWYVAYLHRPTTPTDEAAIPSLLPLRDEQIEAIILASGEYYGFSTILFIGPLDTTTNFWVQATNGCAPTNSNTATITINGCNKPLIELQPADQTIGIGGMTSMAVIASGPAPLGYQWYQGTSGDTTKPFDGQTQAVLGIVLDTPGTVPVWVRVSNGCGVTASASRTVTVTCSNPPAMFVKSPPAVPSGAGYLVNTDTRLSIYTKFDLQESTSIDFTNPTTFTSPNGTFTIPAHTVTSDTRFFYRVRGYLNCSSSQPGAFSGAGSTLVVAPPAANALTFNLLATPCTARPCKITQPLFVPGFAKSGKMALDATDQFFLSVDKPWLSVSPSSGPLPQEGTTVTLTIDTSDLTFGSTEGTVSVVRVSATSTLGVLGSTSGGTPVSVSLVSGTSPKAKDGNAPINTLLIPAIAHLDGAGGSHFQSDVRLTNTSTQSIQYQLTFTPSNIDGTTAGKSTTINVDAGTTTALNDVVKNFFGAGVAGDPGGGTMEIRPLNYAGKDASVNVQFVTVAASRTYNTTASGTYGQFIPALPLANFLTKSATSKISLQQLAESASYRTNLGFAEGGGQPADLLVTLFDGSGNAVAQRALHLDPFKQTQSPMAAFFGVPAGSIPEGRVQVEVTSDTGKVTAYASVLDNATSDPLLVFPTDPTKITTSRYVVPGVAELNNGAANFHTDMRIFNGGAAKADVTLTYVPQGGGSSPAPLTMTVQPGEVKPLDNVLPSLWQLTNTGGAVIATTPADSQLVFTARTFSRNDTGGTFGQFIPGVTANDAVGLGDQPLNVVQLEQSPSFRSNLGLVEVTGNEVTVEIKGYSPDSKVVATLAPKKLGPGEFTQLGGILAGMGFGNVYNGRITVRVIDGDGKVAAYGSVIDNRTQDPTYVPAQ